MPSPYSGTCRGPAARAHASPEPHQSPGSEHLREEGFRAVGSFTDLPQAPFQCPPTPHSRGHGCLPLGTQRRLQRSRAARKPRHKDAPRPTAAASRRFRSEQVPDPPPATANGSPRTFTKGCVGGCVGGRGGGGGAGNRKSPLVSSMNFLQTFCFVFLRGPQEVSRPPFKFLL